jgi:hypothetical protein
VTAEGGMDREPGSEPFARACLVNANRTHDLLGQPRYTANRDKQLCACVHFVPIVAHKNTLFDTEDCSPEFMRLLSLPWQRGPLDPVFVWRERQLDIVAVVVFTEHG